MIYSDETMNQPTQPHGLRHIFKTQRPLLHALAALALMRMIAIIVTPLEFGVDEAQYWLWGQQLDFGYYSKPPLIGWFTGMMDALFGASAIAARLLTPVLHSVIALTLFDIASRYHSVSAGRWAALLWASLPIVSLGSFVISTDTLLLVPWVFALAILLRAKAENNARYFFVTGLIIGIGFLAKYAAIYFVLGAAILLWRTTSYQLGQSLRYFSLILAGAFISASPNILWNIANGGITFAHLGENADLAAPTYSFASAFEFLLSQSAVIGPLVFVLFCAAILRLKRQDNTAFAASLLYFSLPVIIIMVIQAYLKTANANWAATAWPTACLLIGCALAQANGSDTSAPIIGRFWGRLALSINFFAAAITAISVAAGTLGPLSPQSDPLRRLRGWEALAQDVIAAAETHKITTIIADRRAEAALLSWHLSDSPYQVKVYDSDGRAGSHFEMHHAITNDDRGPFLILTGTDGTLPDRFAPSAIDAGESVVQISQRRVRHKKFFIVK